MEATSPAQRLRRAAAEIRNAYFGPADVVRQLLAALLARGHVLIEGVPGIAKTTLARAFASALDLRFSRIQFTADLLPSDIVGTHVFNPKDATFHLHEGPIFAQLVLGDEINRAPAKTQSAMLEAMQERQVTIEGVTRELPSPVLVVATQNPVETEGTFPLPEAQLDRFLLRIDLHYPSLEDEVTMLERYGAAAPRTGLCMTAADVLVLQEAVARTHVESDLVAYVAGLARHLRDDDALVLGPSPRAALNLLQASKALAVLSERDFVLPEDVMAMAKPVFRHRLLPTPDAAAAGFDPDARIDQALAQIPHRPRGKG
ncbi:MAG: MoxR family ATPase [Deltaproteobacteria bacterium]|nr:MoxR family ATPase [Deltaproteobacteria bacterium]